MASFPCTSIGPVWLTAHALTRGIVRHERVLQVGVRDIEVPAHIPDDPDGAAARNGVTRVRGGWFLSYTEALAEARRMAEARQAKIEKTGVAHAGEAEWRHLTKIIQNTIVVRDGETGEVIPCA